jgi:ribonuclease-3
MALDKGGAEGARTIMQESTPDRLVMANGDGTESPGGPPGTIVESDLARIRGCEEEIRYRFRDPALLLQALTHSSIKTADNPSNERLEFLGDSVLGLVMTEFLYNFFQSHSEGDLTQIKSVVVSTSVLARESERLSLDQYYSVGKGVIRKKKLPVSLLANVFEAVVAAIYKDAGLEMARRFVVRNLYHQVLAVAENRHRRNYKSILQQWAQKELNLTPTYRVVAEKGPDHLKSFEVVALVGKRKCRSGMGRSKKEAEQIAARETLKVLLLEKHSGSEKPPEAPLTEDNSR